MAFLLDRPASLGRPPTLPTPQRYHRFPKAARLPFAAMARGRGTANGTTVAVLSIAAAAVCVRVVEMSDARSQPVRRLRCHTLLRWRNGLRQAPCRHRALR
jgi:hypothetical protein